MIIGPAVKEREREIGLNKMTMMIKGKKYLLINATRIISFWLIIHFL
jgi:hypothetical protein